MAQHSLGVASLLKSDALDGEFKENEPMARHTTYRIGGPARYFVRVDSVGFLERLLDVCLAEDTPFTVVGKGSNLLVSDDGYDGVVITLGRDFKNIVTDDGSGRIVAGSAVLLASVVQEALKHSLSGLEFAVGTPGTIGGAIRMNAGSKDEWIGSRVVSVTTVSSEDGLLKRAGDEIDWTYRQSSLRSDEIVVECALSVQNIDPFYIRGKMEGNLEKRKRSQPLNLPSCGSVFKNPEGASAAWMIDSLGLKGRTCGGAQISEKHANFIVNLGGAKAADVLGLMDIAREEVNKAYGIELTPEVKLLGFQ